MNCPRCHHARTAIIGQRQSPERTERQRKCLKCRHGFTTVEVSGLGLGLLLEALEVQRVAGACEDMVRNCERIAARLTRAAQRLTPTD